MSMLQEDREKVIKVVRAHLPNATIYLFGPRERSECEPCEDARIAIDDRGHHFRAELIQQLHDELNNMPGSYSYDVYDLNRMTESDQKEIRAHGAKLA